MNDSDALLGSWVQRFLVHHLVTERNLSRNTCKSYRDTFKLLVPFAYAELGKQDYQLTVPNLSSELVRRFLDHLEEERGCCTHTRNLRLTAIRAFARFVASRDPAHVVWRGQINAIASKKTTIKPVAWLSVDEMYALLDVPDRTTRCPVNCVAYSLDNLTASTFPPTNGYGRIIRTLADTAISSQNCRNLG